MLLGQRSPSSMWDTLFSIKKHHWPTFHCPVYTAMSEPEDDESHCVTYNGFTFRKFRDRLHPNFEELKLGDKIIWPQGFTRSDWMRELQEFKAREDDVYVCSYPKSGKSSTIWYHVHFSKAAFLLKLSETGYVHYNFQRLFQSSRNRLSHILFSKTRENISFWW